MPEYKRRQSEKHETDNSEKCDVLHPRVLEDLGHGWRVFDALLRDAQGGFHVELASRKVESIHGDSVCENECGAKCRGYC